MGGSAKTVPLAYTIVKFGTVDTKYDEGGDTATTVMIQPGDIFDGGIGPKAAAHVLLQATIYQPYAQKLCAKGGLGGVDMDASIWNDKFLCLSGPELLRMDVDRVSTGHVTEEYDANTATTTDFEDLCQYIALWSETYNSGGGGGGTSRGEWWNGIDYASDCTFLSKYTTTIVNI